MQRLVKVGDEVADEGERLLPLFRCQVGVAELAGEMQYAFGHAATVRTVPDPVVFRAVARDIDVVKR